MDRVGLPSIAAAIDLKRYPIAPLDVAPGRALARRCRAQLAASGACLLPGFLMPDAVARMAAAAASIAPLAHRKAGGRGAPAYPAPVAGATLDLIALLGDDTESGTLSGERLKLARYGRSEPIAAAP